MTVVERAPVAYGELEQRMSLRNRIELLIIDAVANDQVAALHLDDGPFLPPEERTRLTAFLAKKQHHVSGFGKIAMRIEAEWLAAKLRLRIGNPSPSERLAAWRKVTHLHLGIADIDSYTSETQRGFVYNRLHEATVSIFLVDHPVDPENRLFSQGSDNAGRTMFSRMQTANGNGFLYTQAVDGAPLLTPIDVGLKGNGLLVTCAVDWTPEQIHSPDDAFGKLTSDIPQIVKQPHVSVEYALRSAGGGIVLNTEGAYINSKDMTPLPLEASSEMVARIERFLHE